MSALQHYQFCLQDFVPKVCTEYQPTRGKEKWLSQSLTKVLFLVIF